ncbi:lysylphosphatidylglycerol synthase transmembrane domain-containing protein [Amycolatopsis benzoatilytica]|uniref:lysylphosphatidylglycerol synthase transmembrane domain-containing protein n=1 Tax=Amycolatopsis benzoatilytica TaxID=346045 RepID=UPI00037A4884|nr:lysylphosphatidylglycerol synthase transmembrane domain-containing protein [Amycolatopsis benzoatilytica]
MALWTALKSARRSRWRLVADWVLAAAGLGVAVWQLTPTLATTDDLGARLASLRWGWLGMGVASGMASLAAYGELQRLLLVSGGNRLRSTTVQAVNFVGNAIAQSVPSAGATAGVAYTVAALRRRGVDTGLSLWATTVAAILSASLLLAAAPFALAFDGLLGWWPATGLACAITLLTGAAGWLIDRPASLAWVSRQTVAIARHLPIGRLRRWAAAGSQATGRIFARIARLRPRSREWAWFAAVAAVSWVLDLWTLACCGLAAAESVPWPALIVGFLAVQASIGIQLTPNGAGPAETALLATLTAGGLAAPTAAIAVLLYRCASWLLPTAAGWLTFLAVSHHDR